MQFPDINKKLIIIIGPTGVGKTKLAIELAQAIDGEIVSADSRSFYRGMDIGTAKPKYKERAQIKHHLIDCVNPDTTISLAQFQQVAMKKIDEIQCRNKIPVLVGGTGQYIRAITDGWVPPQQAPDENLRNVLNKWAEEIGSDAFYKKLLIIDPEAAAKIDPKNIRRVIRAFEVIFRTGKKFSDQKGKKITKYNYILIGLNTSRQKLYERIDQRIDKMIENGLLDEVTQLLEEGYSEELPAFTAIGYHEAIECLKGNITLEEARMLMKRRTRQYVRRQANWFKKDDERINWFNIDNLSVRDILPLMDDRSRWVIQDNKG